MAKASGRSLAAGNAERLAALLGSVNVGGRRVTMETLRVSFEALGLVDVESVIASGNILFGARGLDSATRVDLERRLEDQLAQDLGYEVPVFLRTDVELNVIAATEPFGEPLPAGGTDSVQFLKTAPTITAPRLAACETDMDQLRLAGRELHWRCRGGVSDTKLKWPKLARELGLGPVTSRNRTTVRKLADRCRSA